MKKNRLFLFLVIPSILILFVQIVAHLSRPMIDVRQGMGNSYVRISQLLNGNVPKLGVWQPLFFNLLKHSIDKMGPYLGPRIFSVIVFMFLCYVLYIFTNRLYNNKVIASLALFLLITSDFFTDYLTFPLTEVLYSGLFLLGLYFVFFYRNYKHLFLSLIFITIANALRLDGWILLPLLSVYVFHKSKNVKTTVLYSLISLTYPIYYIWANYQNTGDLFYLIKDYSTQTLQTNMYFYIPIFEWLKEFILDFNAIFFIIFLLFLVISFIKKKIKEREKTILIIASLSLFILFVLRTRVAPADWYPDQYLFFPIVILYPILAYAIFSVIKNKKSFIFVAITIFRLGNNYYFKIKNYSYPEIVTKLINVSNNCIYVFGQNYYPFDRDFIMYLGNKINYEDIEVSNFDRHSTYGGAGCFVFDKLRNKNLYLDSLIRPDCKINYQDQRFKLYFCN